MDPEHIDLIGHSETPTPLVPNETHRKDSSVPAKGLMPTLRRLWNILLGHKEIDDRIVAARSLVVGRESTPKQGFDVNLIPELDEKKSQRRSVRMLFSSALITLGIVLIAYLFLLRQRSSVRGDLSDIQNQLQTVEATINRLQPVQKEALELRTRVVASDYVLDRHVYWTSLLSEIEDLTLPSVTYKNFVSDQKGVVSMTATTESYEELGKQLKIFESSEKILDVQVTGVAGASSGKETETGAGIGTATTTENAIEFSINLSIDPKILTREPSTDGSE